MANLIRWEPIRELNNMQDLMDRLLDDGYSRPISRALWDVASVPTMDLRPRIRSWSRCGFRESSRRISRCR
jgi:hypothetical protein